MFTNISRPSAVDVLRPFEVGDIFTADTTSTLAKVADVAVGNVLLSGGVGAIPAWGKVTLSSHISGVLPAVNGGTGVANTGTITNAGNITFTGTGTIATGTFTLTVPATGTAGLLGVANNWALANTFSLGTGTSIIVSSTTDSSSKDTGTIVTEGGVGVEKSVTVGTVLGVGGAPVARASFYTATDTTPTTVSAWDTRHVLIGTGTASGTGLGLSVNQTSGMSHLLALSPGVAWRELKIFSSILSWDKAGGGVAITFSTAGNLLVGTTADTGITGAGGLHTTNTTDGTAIGTAANIFDGGVSVGKRLVLDGATGKTIKYVNGTANAAVAVTFGAVGPTGSTAGNQVGWIRVDIGGTDRYIPYW